MQTTVMKNVLLVFGLIFSLQASAQHPLIDSVLVRVRIDSLMHYAEQISGEKGVVINGVTDTIKTRHKLKAGNELAYRFLIEKMGQYNVQIDSMVFSSTGKNILAIQPGAVYPNIYVILCAHYDSMPNSNISPAADDDGSGVAAVMEAIRILSQFQFEYTIVYAIWDEEEQGKIGSAAYANMARNDGDSIRGVINMDAIAWDGNGDNAAMIHTSSISNSLNIAAMIDNVNNTYNIGLDLYLTNPGATYSDHASFWNKQYGAVLVIEDWAFDANPHYHTVTDKVQYFNIPYFEKMAKLSIASTAELAVPISFLGSEQEETSTPVQVFPNPFSDGIWIRSERALSFQLCDFQGKILHLGSTNNQTYIALSDLPTGIYVLHIQDNKGVSTVKVIKY
ncbi:MAG TPA: hypothetical protein DEP18_08305 [Flavobacteriales bacterium]|nr:hypothetical protein [Flavobacteriales bacterium]HRE75804.1 M20/M25/M40 family metallo-hydrolase [Flavobacteriales bacterium]HRJ37169.1 M20/M25/M40 family metallo-hydrolase [Flavobacteriales bacterium]